MRLNELRCYAVETLNSASEHVGAEMVTSYRLNMFICYIIEAAMK